MDVEMEFFHRKEKMENDMVAVVEVGAEVEKTDTQLELDRILEILHHKKPCYENTPMGKHLPRTKGCGYPGYMNP